MTLLFFNILFNLNQGANHFFSEMEILKNINKTKDAKTFFFFRILLSEKHQSYHRLQSPKQPIRFLKIAQAPGFQAE